MLPTVDHQGCVAPRAGVPPLGCAGAVTSWQQNNAAWRPMCAELFIFLDSLMSRITDGANLHAYILLMGTTIP